MRDAKLVFGQERGGIPTMDINAMKFLSKRLSLLIAALLAFTMAASVVPAAAQEIAPEHLALARKYVD
ncbi:MAG: hypothetical protein EOP19_05775, partial [Hyphomicrobiales bacterium]